MLLLLGLLLRPLLQHTDIALHHEDVLIALYQRVTFDDELAVLVRGQAVLHPVPLPQSD